MQNNPIHWVTFKLSMICYGLWSLISLDLLSSFEEGDEGGFAKLSLTTFTYCSPSYLYHDVKLCMLS
jgi:hypothetical protein